GRTLPRASRSASSTRWKMARPRREQTKTRGDRQGTHFPWASAWAKMPNVAMGESVVPTASAEDDDDVVVALETARVSEERGDIEIGRASCRERVEVLVGE